MQLAKRKPYKNGFGKRRVMSKMYFWCISFKIAWPKIEEKMCLPVEFGTIKRDVPHLSPEFTRRIHKVSHRL